MNENHYKWLMSLGVNVITLGNHAYHNKNILTFIDEAKNIVRPYNFPEESPGRGYTTINYNGIKITVFQVIGNVFMKEGNESPFTKTEELLEKVESDIYICDFHGESTSEKIAYAYNFDGKIQIIFGTHTHVPTNDARLLSNGTAYITDVGMTGSLEGVIGVKKEIIIDRYVHGESRPNEVALGKRQLNACLITLHPYKKIETIHLEENEKLM